MRKVIAALLIMVSLASCKTKQLVAEGSAEEKESVKQIADGHYKNEQDFKTLQINAKVKYKSEGTSLPLDADIRIKKDEMILVSISILGIPQAKGIVTPKGVSYYSKANDSYYEGDFAGLTNLLKIDTDLNYESVQNMLLGMAMDDLKKGNYKVTVEEGMHKLQSKEQGDIFKEFLFEGKNYLLKQQQIKQTGYEPRSLTVSYPNFKEESTGRYPTDVNIEAADEKKVNIDVQYKNITFDKEGLKFAYKIPEGLTRITIE